MQYMPEDSVGSRYAGFRINYGSYDDLQMLVNFIYISVYDFNKRFQA